MILATVDSINGVPVRLTEERWDHILDNHLELSDSDMDLILDAVKRPEYILSGYKSSLIAIIVLGSSRYLHVVYREVNRDDGFIITAGIRPKMRRKNIIWRR
jgi:hypothetical protein